MPRPLLNLINISPATTIIAINIIIATKALPITA